MLTFSNPSSMRDEASERIWIWQMPQSYPSAPSLSRRSTCRRNRGVSGRTASASISIPGDPSYSFTGKGHAASLPGALEPPTWPKPYCYPRREFTDKWLPKDVFPGRRIRTGTSQGGCQGHMHTNTLVIFLLQSQIQTYGLSGGSRIHENVIQLKATRLQE